MPTAASRRRSASPGRSRAAGRPPAAELRHRLDALSRNLWWTWNPPARRVLESVDPALWHATNHNPIATLAHAAPTRVAALEHDADFLEALDRAEHDLGAYLRTRSWFDRTAKGAQKKLRVAYFCMEFGLHECLPLYAGGLGILAADHLKSASDLGIPLTAVGVLWRKGYYRQELKLDGSVRITYPQTNFASIPVVDTGRSITVPIGPSKVRAKIWSLTVGRVPLYLLDCDVPENSPKDRELTHFLYGAGDPEYRVRQEVLLGVGGLIALDALGIKPSVFHLNEGHAAFCPLERVRRLVASGKSYPKAVETVRQSSVFTTHTPVPEGNDRFDAKLIMKYFGGMPDDLGVSRQQFLGLGREDVRNDSESFCMTVLALKLGARCNGVAELHADTSRKMWMKVYGATKPSQVPIGFVTNGVHPESWIADEARPFYDRWLKPVWNGAGPEHDWWKKADKVPPAELWQLRQTLRKAMIAKLRERLREQIVAQQGDVDRLVELYETLDENALTIGFARRFALYKRAPLIFKDARRLAKIMGDPDRPVQILFAGKAHPADKGGHEYVQLVGTESRRAPWRGRIFLVQNYDTHVGRMLTSGCDVWLNNPVRPLEASGTSGMKPPLNGGLNCSILDGWWPEAYNAKNGWELGGAKAFPDRARQDAHDAKAIYDTLERKVVPTFYARDRAGIPKAWVSMMSNSMKTICATFSTHRMLAQYTQEYYLPSHG